MQMRVGCANAFKIATLRSLKKFLLTVIDMRDVFATYPTCLSLFVKMLEIKCPNCELYKQYENWQVLHPMLKRMCLLSFL